MPTHDEDDSFWHDCDRLTEAQQDAFLAAVAKMVDEIRAARGNVPQLFGFYFGE